MKCVDGLRERKKAATRSALIAAALRLAVERGPDGVTVEDIADAAGVSVRTFFNYFATKEAAFVADDLERGRRFVAAVVGSAADRPVWDLLREAAASTMVSAELPGHQQTLKLQLVRTSPTVVAEVLGAFAELEHHLVAELARRLPRSAPLQVHLMANAVIAAVRAATETWLASPGSTTDAYAVLLDDAFTILSPAFAADSRHSMRG